MANGIIVVDMPESCLYCDLCTSHQASALSVREYWCPAMGCMEVNVTEKPDWCPIKPLPEKMDHQSRHGLLQEQIMVGWNMCIDEILGEEGPNDNT